MKQRKRKQILYKRACKKHTRTFTEKYGKPMSVLKNDWENFILKESALSKIKERKHESRITR